MSDEDLLSLPPLERAAAAEQKRQKANTEQARWARVRAEALREANHTMTMEEIAAALGISIAAVSAAIAPLRRDDAELLDTGAKLLLAYAPLGQVALEHVTKALATPARSLAMKAKRVAIAAKSAVIDFGSIPETDQRALRQALARAHELAYPDNS